MTAMIRDYATADAIRAATETEVATYVALVARMSGSEREVGAVAGAAIAPDLPHSVYVDGVEIPAPLAPAPESLDELLHLLRDGSDWDGAPMAHGELDWTSLPTFGGEAPRDTTGIWSWDTTHLLVGSGQSDVQIVARADWQRDA